jgi:hypothetical protein
LKHDPAEKHRNSSKKNRGNGEKKLVKNKNWQVQRLTGFFFWLTVVTVFHASQQAYKYSNFF